MGFILVFLIVIFKNIILFKYRIKSIFMEDLILKRISIISLILIILFGVIEYTNDKTYDTLNTEFALKVFATSFFSALLMVVLIYLILIGINIGYDTHNMIPEKLLRGFYNLVIISSLLMILFIIFFIILVNLTILIPFFTPELASIFLMVFFVLWSIIFIILLAKYVF